MINYNKAVEWYQLIRIIAIAGAIIMVCCSFVYDVHVPSGEDHGVEDKIKQKDEKDAHDKEQKGKDLSPKDVWNNYQWNLNNTASNDNNTPSGCMDQGSRGGG